MSIKMIRFINDGNDCYLNSVLQALFNTYSFICFFKFKRPDENLIIQTFRSMHDTNGLINPRDIKKLLGRFDKESSVLFHNNDQQDAHEAIVKILDIVHMSSSYNETNFNDYGKIDTEIKQRSFDSWKKNSEVFGFSFITRFFGGQFKTLISCTDCDYRSTSFDNFNNINLPIKGEDVIDCLSDFIKPEDMPDAKCEKCAKRGLTKTTTIWKFPLTLILNIKRFAFDSDGTTRKVGQLLKMDKHLKICSSKHVYNYSLTSVVYHHGRSPNTGHYNTDILKNDSWYKLDDEHTMPIELPDFSSNCYILVYNFGRGPT